MWTVEYVIHRLDLYPGRLPGVHPGPVPEALAVASRMLDGLLGAGAQPPSWDDVTYVLKGTGRFRWTMPTASSWDRARRYPSFGLARTVTPQVPGNHMLHVLECVLKEG